MRYAMIFLLGYLLGLGDVKAQDNDDLAFEFISQTINTDGEVMYIARECYEDSKITDEEYAKTLIHDTKNVTLDPRNYCEDLKKTIKGWK